MPPRSLLLLFPETPLLTRVRLDLGLGRDCDRDRDFGRLVDFFLELGIYN